MSFWVFALIFCFFIPVMSAVIGILMKKYPPKEINNIIGYRTRRSLKSPEAWAFANRCFAELSLKFSGITAVPALVMLLFINRDYETVSFVLIAIMTVQCFIYTACILMTEHRLKRNFDENGTPKYTHKDR